MLSNYVILYGGMAKAFEKKLLPKVHPCHQSQLLRLKRVEGQIRGVSKMVEEGRYCVDILTQLKAIKSAISAVEANVLEAHLNNCVQRAVSSKNADQTEQVIKEIKDLLKKR